uniref:Uncharacterized protein n=1 Tax=Rhizophora mucronata TaxID=61149 RepID=A0A2P2Q1U7_RHIMU
MCVESVRVLVNHTKLLHLGLLHCHNSWSSGYNCILCLLLFVLLMH